MFLQPIEPLNDQGDCGAVIEMCRHIVKQLETLQALAEQKYDELLTGFEESLSKMGKMITTPDEVQKLDPVDLGELNTGKLVLQLDNLQSVIEDTEKYIDSLKTSINQLQPDIFLITLKNNRPDN
jgi:hypothetical protein